MNVNNVDEDDLLANDENYFYNIVLPFKENILKTN
jgi:hypothetical protein